MRRSSVLRVVIGLVLSVAVAEATLELVGATYSFLAYSETRGWRLRPGVEGWHAREGQAWVSINADGLRGPHVTRTKPPGTWRIAVLGDSFVEAIHVAYEKTFTAVLERALNDRCPAREGRRAEVVNFGVSGYGTAQEFLTLRDQVWPYEPDVVVLAMFIGNDVAENSDELDSASVFTGERCRPYIRWVDGRLTVDGPFGDTRLGRFYCWVNLEGRRSAVLQVLGEATFAGLTIATTWRDAATHTPGREAGLDDAIYGPPPTEAWHEAWQITERLVVTMAHEARARAASFLAVTLSTPIQVHPAPAYRARYLAAVGGTDLFYPEHRLRALGAKEGFPVLTLAPDMQRQAEQDEVFFHGFHNTRPGTGHWNARGHEFAGRAMAGALCRHDAG